MGGVVIVELPYLVKVTSIAANMLDSCREHIKIVCPKLLACVRHKYISGHYDESEGHPLCLRIVLLERGHTGML